MRPEISIIIVNYNAGSFLPSCIESIQNQTLTSFEIILIDNASVDGSLDLLPNDDRISIYRNPTNLGFAKAQNQGIRLAKGRYIMPLNFDILLEATFLKEMVSAIESGDKIGSVAPKLLRMVDGNAKTAQIDNSGLLLPANRQPIHRGGGEQDRGQYDESVQVFGAMGAAALYRREMLDDIAYQGQYFDETYFMWYEDIDLEWRAKLRGWGCVYTPSAVAYHAGDPHGHGRSKLGARISMRNRWMMISANECPTCLLRNFGPLLSCELGLINHIVRHGLIFAYLGALASTFIHLPYIYQKRRWIRSRATISCLPEYPIPYPT